MNYLSLGAAAALMCSPMVTDADVRAIGPTRVVAGAEIDGTLMLAFEFGLEVLGREPIAIDSAHLEWNAKDIAVVGAEIRMRTLPGMMPVFGDLLPELADVPGQEIRWREFDGDFESTGGAVKLRILASARDHLATDESRFVWCLVQVSGVRLSDLNDFESARLVVRYARIP